MEKFRQQFSNYNIVFACKTGSQLFCSNCNDVDYLVVVDNLNRATKSHHIEDTDYFCMSVDEFVKMATMQSGKFYDLYTLCLLYGEVVQGQNPIVDYDWFALKQRAIEVALRCGGQNYFSKNVKIVNDLGDQIRGKRMVWALAIYYTILNGSTTFTDEQKQAMQLCHDKQLPREKADWLQEQLVALLDNRVAV